MGVEVWSFRGAFESAHAVGQLGVSESTIEALETTPGRVPAASTLELLARGLDVEPDVFYEYPIAVARRNARARRDAA